jgi:hypothetical protein
MKPMDQKIPPRLTRKPRCPRCHVGGYRQGRAPDGRPRFTCTRCDYAWTSGKSGGEFLLPPGPV